MSGNEDGGKEVSRCVKLKMRGIMEGGLYSLMAVLGCVLI